MPKNMDEVHKDVENRGMKFMMLKNLEKEIELQVLRSDLLVRREQEKKDLNLKPV